MRSFAPFICRADAVGRAIVRFIAEGRWKDTRAKKKGRKYAAFGVLARKTDNMYRCLTSPAFETDYI